MLFIFFHFQDGKDLWIATHDGLNGYDGFEFKKFLHSPFDKKSLAGNMTIDMAEDDQTRLWILTNTHLHLYHEKDGSFERFICRLVRSIIVIRALPGSSMATNGFY